MSSKRNDRKYAIAAAAIKLFIDNGFEVVTAEDIAAEAGIGVRTFFRYFPTKEQAAFPDHEERVERFRAALQARAGSDTSPVDAVIEVGARSATEYFDNPDLYRPRYRLVRHEAPLRDYERVSDRAYELAIEEFLAKELKGIPHVELVAHVVASGLVAAVNSVLDMWAFGEDVDGSSLLRTATEIARESAHGALAAVRGTAVRGAPPGTKQPASADLVLVFSDDRELRRQVTELVERHRSGWARQSAH